MFAVPNAMARYVFMRLTAVGLTTLVVLMFALTVVVMFFNFDDLSWRLFLAHVHRFSPFAAFVTSAIASVWGYAKFKRERADTGLRSLGIDARVLLRPAIPVALTIAVATLVVEQIPVNEVRGVVGSAETRFSDQEQGMTVGETQESDAETIVGRPTPLKSARRAHSLSVGTFLVFLLGACVALTAEPPRLLTATLFFGAGLIFVYIPLRVTASRLFDAETWTGHGLGWLGEIGLAAAVYIVWRRLRYR